MIVQLKDGVPVRWPLAEHFLSAAHPNTSFSYPPSDAVLAHFGYARFVHSDPAEYDAEFQEPKELPPVVTGVQAVQRWEIVEKYTPEEKAAYIAAKEAAALAAAEQTQPE
jgi:hypothetical protein